MGVVCPLPQRAERILSTSYRWGGPRDRNLLVSDSCLLPDLDQQPAQGVPPLSISACAPIPVPGRVLDQNLSPTRLQDSREARERELTPEPSQHQVRFHAQPGASGIHRLPISSELDLPAQGASRARALALYHLMPVRAASRFLRLPAVLYCEGDSGRATIRTLAGQVTAREVTELTASPPEQLDVLHKENLSGAALLRRLQRLKDQALARA